MPKEQKRKGLPKALREAVWLARIGKKFKGRCAVKWCPNVLSPFTFEVGHNIPVSKGGTNDMDNLFILCSNCNKSMGDLYTIDEFSKLSKPLQSALQRTKKRFGLKCFSLC